MTECSHRLGINEATLVSTVNKFIQGEMEEQLKEARREEARAAAQPPAVEVDAKSDVESKVEYMLTQMVVRHGNEVLYKDVETEDGGKIN